MRYFVILCVLLVALGDMASAELSSLSDAITKTRELNILTQKLSTNYIMIGMNNHYGDTKRRLKEEIVQFGDIVAYLDEFATSKKAFKNIEKVSKAWKAVLEILRKQIQKEYVLKLVQQLDNMLLLTQQTTEIYTRQTGSALGKVIDASANLTVESQRMAVLYLLKSWHASEKDLAEKMRSAMQSFRKSVDTLKAAKINTPETSKILDSIEKDFMYFTMMGNQPTGNIPTLIYKKSNNILQKAKKLSNLYSKLIILN